MVSKYYLVHNPIDANERNLYVYHNSMPRFHACVVIVNGRITLVPVDNIDNVDEETINSKLNKMQRWYVAVIAAQKKQNGYPER